MKHKVLALAVLIAILAILSVGFACTFFMGRHPLTTEKETYQIYASSYPVYAISELIVGDSLGMHLSQLTQPTLEGYTTYDLSDWDKALISQADVIVCMGFGFEGFADDLVSDSTAVINLLSLVELKTVPEECDILDYSIDDSSLVTSPWLYMSIHGMNELCEVMCGNMAYLDQLYSELYYQNLENAQDILEPLAARTAETDVLKGTKVAVAHDALIYTAYDLGAEIALYIKRDTAQELTEEQIEECAQALRRNNVRILLIEDQAEDTMVQRFEESGITVIKLQLMLDLTPANSYSGYIDAYSHNLDTIEKAFDK